MRFFNYFRRRLAAEIADRTVNDADLKSLTEIRFLRRLIDEFAIDCVFDVGANYGQYATMLRRRVGYSGQIISFEPIPAAYEHCQAKAQADGRWTVFNYALSDIDGPATFNIMAASEFSSLKQPSTDEFACLDKLNTVQQSVSVECRRLDGLFAGLQQTLNFKRPMLKMDTQGNDLAVFAGAQGCLSSVIALQSEISFLRLYAQSPTYNESLEAYQRGGFQLSGLVPNNAGQFPHLVEMDCIMINRQIINSGQNRPVVL
jgi:FkbM family methyltransferase